MLKNNLPYHTLSISEAMAAWDSGVNGLAAEEAHRRLSQYGFNELVESGRKSPWRLLIEQFTSTMVLILIAAAVVSAFLGKTTETIAISAIVVLFGLLGFIQEFRAERAMAALKRLAAPMVRVRRDGVVQEISARELVLGDIVLLETGNLVPADLRLVESINLRMQEASLTGESEPVEKETGALEDANLPLGDRKNCAYMGTTATYGRGAGLVTATGMQTELGKIAALIQKVDSRMTPLQKQLDQVGKTLAGVGAAAAVLILIIGLLRGETLAEMFLTAISVAVAVVPEGLPAVVTVTLALGAQRMLRRNALIRQLPAVETLGSVTVICSDKTGTLTENRMTVTVIDVAGHYLELQGTKKHPAPALDEPHHLIPALETQPPTIGLTLAAGALCNDATLSPDPKTGRYTAVGDPTEGALLVAANQAGLSKTDLETFLPRLDELPFDSERKRMTTFHRLNPAASDAPRFLVALEVLHAPFLAITKGAVDGLLGLSTNIWVEERILPMDSGWEERIHRANEQMAQNGMRVLGIAVRPFAQPLDELGKELESELVFVGLVGMIDPPRPEVRQAVKIAKEAGIRPIMITGDHPLTARFIAHDLGISTNGRVKTGADLEQKSETDLEEILREVSVFARVSPEHKLRIVQALQRQGEVVAMTGDGVNDSPALKKADIGVAMGITGTDVSKEAAKMVLVDDNFATIVAAVEEGRVIFDNIRRFVKYSIAGNFGKVLVMLLSPFLGMNVGLLPLQLLWLNLLTDGLLGLGLGLEPAEKDTMRLPPRNPQAGFFTRALATNILWVGALIGIVTLAMGWLFFDPENPGDTTWQTIMFTSLAFLQIGQALASRSSQQWLFKTGAHSNPALIWLIVLAFGLQLFAIYAPFLEEFFQVKALSLVELLACGAAGSLSFIVIKLSSYLNRSGK